MMISIEIREKFAKLKNGGFDRETHDSFGYDVFMVNGQKEVQLFKGDFAVMVKGLIVKRQDEKQRLKEEAILFANQVQHVLGKNGNVRFIEFDLETERAKILGQLSEQQRAVLGV